MELKFEVVFCIVNEGFSCDVMDAARRAGAQGGTVLSARGTAIPEVEKLFNVTIRPEKEIAIIVIPTHIRDAVLKELYDSIGPKTNAQGISFSLPVDKTVGINFYANNK